MKGGVSNAPPKAPPPPPGGGVGGGGGGGSEMRDRQKQIETKTFKQKHKNTERTEGKKNLSS